ncbi:hypothetical protein [Sphaerotilus sp.]|uniref:hypothetical protein n=1 Tax=Sphaerotilus sp. TaxID=2093942 RepID=UPI002ACEE802|nr:hypothetical protein [Sphaerotilus sp.]MDZ7857504.1 hypothetical protein [Sphaerotilus sp.]
MNGARSGGSNGNGSETGDIGHAGSIRDADLAITQVLGGQGEHLPTSLDQFAVDA